MVISNSNDNTNYYTSEDSISNSISISSEPSLPSLVSLNLHTLITVPPSLRHCIATIKAHSSYVSCLVMSSSRTLISCSSDQNIKLWHVPNRNHELSNTSSIFVKSPVKSIIVSNNQILFSSHQDGKIRAWRINLLSKNHKLSLLAVLPIFKDRVLSLLFPIKYVLERTHKKSTWVHHADSVSALTLSNDRKFLYSASWDRSFKIWSTLNFRCIESVPHAHEDAINAIVVSIEGFVYTGSADKKIKAWKILPRETKHCLVSTLEKHKSAVNSLALSEDGLILYSGACDRSVVVWEGGGGEMVATGALRGHKMAVLCLAINGDLVCSGSADKTVRVWKREVHEIRFCYSCLAVLDGHVGAVKCLAFGETEEDGSICDSDIGNVGSFILYSGGMDCEIRVWKVSVPQK